MEDKIIVIAKVEDDSYDGKEFKKVTDKAGDTWNVKYGQGGKLKDKWGLLEEGVAIKLTMGSYQGKAFVKDIEQVKDVFVAEAAKKVQQSQATSKEDSIEKQVAIKEIGFGWREGMFKDGDDEVVRYRLWLLNQVSEFIPSGPVQKAETKTKPTSLEAGGTEETETFENAGQFLTACNKKKKLPRSVVLAELNVNDPSEIPDLNEAWQTICRIHKET